MIKPGWKIENGLWKKGYKHVAGIDEVGYGAWVGPVVVGAVIWRAGYCIRGMQDSKLLKAGERLFLADKIRKKAFSWGIGEGSIDEINKLGLAGAKVLAVRRALAALGVKPDYVLIDGFKMPVIDVEQEAIKGGDGISPSIASASIIAKVYRDRILSSLHRLYKRYGWSKNKGYGTRFHHDMIRKYGLTAHHRVNYKCFKGIDVK